MCVESVLVGQCAGSRGLAKFQELMLTWVLSVCVEHFFSLSFFSISGGIMWSPPPQKKTNIAICVLGLPFLWKALHQGICSKVCLTKKHRGILFDHLTSHAQTAFCFRFLCPLVSRVFENFPLPFDFTNLGFFCFKLYRTPCQISADLHNVLFWTVEDQCKKTSWF